MRRDSAPTHALPLNAESPTLRKGSGAVPPPPGPSRGRGSSDLYSSRRGPAGIAWARHEPQAKPGAPAFSPRGTHHNSGCRSSYSALTPQARRELLSHPPHTGTPKKLTTAQARSLPPSPLPAKGGGGCTSAPLFVSCALVQPLTRGPGGGKKRAALSRFSRPST